MEIDDLMHWPGVRTDRFALPGHAVFQAREGYVAASTPDNADFWYGHRLLLPGPPWAEGVEVWRRRWLAELPDPARRPPKAYICWEQREADPGHAERARAAGVGLETQRVRRHDGRLPPLPPRPPGLVVRPIRTAAEWAAATGVSERAFGLYNSFFSWSDAARRRRIDAGGGVEWGAFLGGELVGRCGLMQGEGEARFQDVAVDPAHHGRKIGAHMLATAVRAHVAAHPGEAVWITADVGARPERIYGTLGFEPVTWSYEVVIAIGPSAQPVGV